MICPICGSSNDDNLQFCGKCGANMTYNAQGYYAQYEGFEQATSTAPDEAPSHTPNYQQSYYQQPDYQQPNGYYPQPTKKDPGKVLGIVGFALAMGSLVLSDGMIFAIAGIIVSAIGLNKSKKEGFNNGFAKAGLITSIVVTCVSVLIIGLILALYAFIFFGQMLPNYM